jgi:hypothetical protein
MRLDEIGRKLQGAATEFGCPGSTAAGELNGRKVAQGVGVIRLQLEGTLVTPGCLFKSAQSAICGREIVVKDRLPGIDGNCPADRFNGRLAAAALMFEDSQEMQRISIPRAGRKHLAIELLCCREIARLMLLQSPLKRSADLIHRT